MSLHAPETHLIFCKKMKELRELAWQSFQQQQRFSRVESKIKYYCIEARTDTPDHVLHESLVSEFELLEVLRSRHPDATASLTFLEISANGGYGGLQVTQQTFSQLFFYMNLDLQVLYLMVNFYDGYHQLNGPDNTPTEFIGTSRFSLIWSHQSQSKTTTALVINRRTYPFPELFQLSRIYRNHTENPQLLPFLAIVYIIRLFDRETSQDLVKIHEVETQTGYGPENPIPPGTRFNFDDISVWLRDIGALQAHFANKHRQLGVVRKIITSLKRRPRGNTNVTNSHERLCEALPSLTNIINTLDDYITYLEERTGTLISILFALLTHEDAAINTDLAQSSYEIAEASKKDSSSMKAITVLTMAFLPATFFATLFALPTLQWDAETVIQGKFWVYWAFTIPSTALIFLMWICLLNQKRIWGCLKR
ncbi:hypothetical protein BO71DRAFT_477145 [Aspergillus ellipticus CBS 707.79]|uniref:Mg2+ transporter protein n=1 Tax=Aspergillus ellipticus CBS 707.79 TaxID=1448320 RepID=A0A319DA31_9EURO|nr:hypothetical protein BO71DRAFT_477145 [Aspergillus ellipticus CBS 707.79]